LSTESARFQDLEALYDTLREELLSSLAEGVMYLYDIAIAAPAAPTVAAPAAATVAAPVTATVVAPVAATVAAPVETLVAAPGAAAVAAPGAARVEALAAARAAARLLTGVPQLSLLKSHAPNYRYSANTVGAWYEKYLTLFQSRPYIDVNQDHIDNNAVITVYCTLFSGTTGLPNENFAHAVSIYYFTKLAEILPMALDALAYADFENKYQDLLALVRFFRSDAISKISTDLHTFIPQEELINHFDEVLFSCKLDPIKSVHDEYERRLREAKQKQFLANFMHRHPGIQHKAGVPLGGTFIIVYHEGPPPPQQMAIAINTNVAALSEAIVVSDAAAATKPPELATSGSAASPPLTEISASNIAPTSNAPKVASHYTLALSDAINRIKSNQNLVLNPDISFVLGSLSGDIPIFDPNLPLHGLSAQASEIISKAVNELSDGTVIADFFLPYLISCDCASVQFVLPNTPPVFSTDVSCPGSDGTATVTVKAKGGTAPYEINVDKGGYQTLSDTLPLKAGTHTLTIRDAEGIESAPQSVSVATPIVIGVPTYQCSDDFSTYTATVVISGGTSPYAVKGKAVPGNKYTTDAIASGTSFSLEVTDSKQCVGKIQLNHACVKPPCDLPCAGIALRRSYRFWLPEPELNKTYKSFKFDKLVFSFEFPQGKTVDLSTDVQNIIKPTTVADLNANFAKAVGGWLDQINKLIADKTGKASWLTLAYDASQPGRLGTLWIEYFECLKFDIQFTSTYQRPEASEQLRLAYLPEGTTVQSGTAGEVVKIPAYDGTKTDKCEPKTPVVTLCAKAPDLKLTISKTVQGLKATLNVTASGADKPVAFLWEIQDGNPAMTNTQNPTTTFTSNVPKTKLVSVTAFTKEGCKATAVDNIDLPNIG
jgi:hypothetical protein